MLDSQILPIQSRTGGPAASTTWTAVGRIAEEAAGSKKNRRLNICASALLISLAGMAKMQTSQRTDFEQPGECVFVAPASCQQPEQFPKQYFLPL
jgi:hypothetical protein